LTPLAPLDPITIKSPPKFPDPVSKHDDNSADGIYKVAETESVRCISTSSSALSTTGLSSSSTEINEDNFTSTATVTAYETTDAPPSNEKSLSKPTDLILYEFNFRRLLIVALGPPFIALICAFLIGFSIDYDLLLNYEWTCGGHLEYARLTPYDTQTYYGVC
uniref:G_PROTEIN_RECEP_F1_2 domain-containing protein n=1 Tax=Anisakis simplex TaxID=6269 RepID=A0A0M3JDV5_ANISI